MDNEITYIYGLIDPNTDELRYIGKSVNPERRYKRHISKRTEKYNPHLFNWINKLKTKSLLPILEIIEKTTIEKCSELEKYYISICPNLINIHPGVEGGSQPIEIRQKMGRSGSDHPMFGKHHSEESRNKISISSKGHKTWNKGITHSVETRKKMSEFWKGKTNNKWTGETRNKARENTLKQLSKSPHPMLGKHHSEETKLKLSKLRIGTHLSEEIKNKISKSNIGKKHGIQHTEVLLC